VAQEKKDLPSWADVFKKAEEIRNAPAPAAPVKEPKNVVVPAIPPPSVVPAITPVPAIPLSMSREELLRMYREIRDAQQVALRQRGKKAQEAYKISGIGEKMGQTRDFNQKLRYASMALDFEDIAVVAAVNARQGSDLIDLALTVIDDAIVTDRPVLIGLKTEGELGFHEVDRSGGTGTALDIENIAQAIIIVLPSDFDPSDQRVERLMQRPSTIVDSQAYPSKEAPKVALRYMIREDVKEDAVLFTRASDLNDMEIVRR
jgi:hypothetical protein